MLRLLRLALHWQILIAMIGGSLVGMALNLGASHREVRTTDDGRAVRRLDTTDRIEVEITDVATGQSVTRVVDPTGETPGSLMSLSELAKTDPEAYRLFQQQGRSVARRTGDVAQSLG